MPWSPIPSLRRQWRQQLPAQSPAAAPSVTGGSPLPNFQLLIDVSGNPPLTVPSTWTDFTVYARQGSVRRGRQHVLDHFQPGTLTLTVYGRDRVLDAENSAGPYYGKLDINRPIRVNVQKDGAWVPLFTGFIDSITPQWPNNVNEDIVYTASDAMRLLNTDDFTQLGYVWKALQDGAFDLWQFGEFDIGTSTAQDSGPGGYVGAYWNVQLGVPGPCAADPTTAVSIAGPSTLSTLGSATAPITLATGGVGTKIETAPWTWEVWFQPTAETVTAGPVTTQCILEVTAVLGTWTLLAAVAGADQTKWPVGSLIVSFGGTGAFFPTTGGTIVKSPGLVVANNVWHHLVLVAASSTTFTVYLDGVVVGTGTFTLPSGTCSAVGAGGFGTSAVNVFQGSLSRLGWYPGVALTQTQVTDHYNRGLYGFPLETSTARVQDVLTTVGWPSAWTIIPPDNAASVLQQPYTEMWLTSVLSYLQQCELAENGWLFVDVSGNVVFRSRHWRQAYMPVPLSIFGDNPGEVNFKPGLGLVRDNLDLYTWALEQALTGPLGVPAGIPQQAINAAAQAKYGENSVLSETGLIISQDVESLNRAQWQMLRFPAPIPRLFSIAVDPLGDPVNRLATCIMREIGDLVTVNRRPPVGAAFTQGSYVEGITHDIDFGKRTWQVTYALTPQTPVDTTHFWTLGVDTLGSAVLGY